MSNANNNIFKLALKPRYWLTAMGLLAMRVMALLPLRIQLLIGRIIGRLMYKFEKRRRHIASINIDLCFPKLNTKDKKRLLKKNFESVGISLVEIAFSWWGNERRLKPLAHFKGLEHVIHAQEQGRGVLLLGAHFTCLEIGDILLALHIPTINMYKKHRNPLFNAVMKKNRLKHATGIIEHRDIRSFVRELKRGKVCWYAPDQDFGKKANCVFAPFLGVPTATLTATARIAKMSNAVVIPFFTKRRSDGSGYDQIILPPIDNYPSGDDVKDAAVFNEILGEQVLLAPEQYLWLHRRFKSRPAGESKVYKKKNAKY